MWTFHHLASPFIFKATFGFSLAVSVFLLHIFLTEYCSYKGQVLSNVKQGCRGLQPDDKTSILGNLDPVYDSMALTSQLHLTCSHYPGLEHPPAENRYQRDAAHLSHKIQPTSLLTSSLTNYCANVLIFRLLEHMHSLRSNV